MKDEADKHRAVVAAADDLQAVVAELNAGHAVRVPPQRELLLMAQPRTSAPVHAAANDTTMSNHNTHLLPTLRIPYLHGPVTRPADDVLAVRRVRY